MMQVEPAVKDAASRVEPAAKDLTEGQLKPAADTIAQKAVPTTKAIGEKHSCAVSPTHSDLYPQLQSLSCLRCCIVISPPLRI